MSRNLYFGLSQVLRKPLAIVYKWVTSIVSKISKYHRTSFLPRKVYNYRYSLSEGRERWLYRKTLNSSPSTGTLSIYLHKEQLLLKKIWGLIDHLLHRVSLHKNGIPMMRVKKESEKGGLELNIQKTKTMPSSPITWWQTEGEKVETVADFIFLGSKITVASDCSHEIKRCLLLGRKALTKLRQCIKKQRHRFANKGLYSQSYGFSSSHV